MSEIRFSLKRAFFIVFKAIKISPLRSENATKSFEIDVFFPQNAIFYSGLDVLELSIEMLKKVE